MRPWYAAIVLSAVSSLYASCHTVGRKHSTDAVVASSGSAASCTASGGTVLMLPDCATADGCQKAIDDDDYKAGLPRVAFCQIDHGYVRGDTFDLAAQGKAPLAVTKYLAHQVFEPNDHLNQPADFYCTQPSVGATLHMYLSPAGGEVNFCEFSDGSSIGDWTLYYGSGSDAPAGQQAMIKVLRGFSSPH